MSFYDNLQAEALCLGFDLVGITNVTPTEGFGIFQKWLQEGLNASMHYLSGDRSLEVRAHPESVLNGANSIILLGMRYFPSRYLDSFTNDTKGDITGKVASYAWGSDYHLIIPPLLEKMVTWILRNSPNQHQKTRWRIYTDTGPILERELAQRAGLGFFGKNSNLISQVLGSYFFIAEIFITLELQPSSSSFDDHCGNCTRCVDACPTHCILPNRTIDARRCISFLTIENKKEIPINLRPYLDQWVFGCDICQLVCPWNKRMLDVKKTENTPMQYYPDINIARPKLIDDLFLSPQEFIQKFKNSPIKRTRRRGYLRNVAVAIGNLKLPEFNTALISSMQEEVDPLVRGHVAWALGRSRTSNARNALDRFLKSENDPYVRVEIINALNE